MNHAPWHAPFNTSTNTMFVFPPMFITNDTNPDWQFDEAEQASEPTLDWSFVRPPSDDKCVTTQRDLHWYHRPSVVGAILLKAVRHFPAPRPVKMLIRRGRAYIGRRGRDI